MDHLILPLYPTQSPMEVPVSSLEDYDSGDFHTYPQRQGWGARAVGKWHAVFRRPPRAFVEFLERWFYFGFMNLVFQQPIQTSDFVRYVGNPGRPVLATTLLPSMVQGILQTGPPWPHPGLENQSLAIAAVLLAHLSFGGTENKRMDPNTLSKVEGLTEYIRRT